MNTILRIELNHAGGTTTRATRAQLSVPSMLLVTLDFAGVTIVPYLTGEPSGDAGFDVGNVQHRPDVQGLVQFAITATARLRQSTTRAQLQSLRRDDAPPRRAQ